MKKVSLVLVCVLLTIPALATGDATPTSKGYVDAQMDTLQDNLPGAAANTVVTTTATAGETGTKAIYDASGNYAEQQNALVAAEDANTAIQMAIDGEFVCREWINDDPVGGCLIWDIGIASYSQYDLVGTNRDIKLFNVNSNVSTTFDSDTKITTILINTPLHTGSAQFGRVLQNYPHTDSKDFINGHKYYFYAKMMATSSDVSVSINRDVKNESPFYATPEWGIRGAIFEASFADDDEHHYPTVYCRTTNSAGGGGVMIDQNIFGVYDLTKIFGVGNEPTTPDDAARALHLLYLPSGN